MKKAIAYTRTATREVAVQSQSINHQEIAIKDYCKAHDIDLLNLFYDIGSGMNFEREGWRELETFLEKNGQETDFIIVTGYDRINRDKDQTLFKMADIQKTFNLSVLVLAAMPDLKGEVL